MSRLLPSAALALVLVLGAGACSVGQSDTDAYRSAAAKAMLNTFGFPLSAGQTRCFARRVVDAIGVKTLQARGITPKQVAAGGLAKITLTDAQVRRLEPALFGGGCVDFTALADALLHGMGGAQQVSAAHRRCVADGLAADAAFRRGFTLLLSQTSASDDASGARLSALFSRCGVDVPGASG